MNEIERFFHSSGHRPITKWSHYFEIYDRHFRRFRGLPVNVVEIGVLNGGSLQMWKEYFGKDSHIIGVDINPECAKYVEKGIDVFIGSQADPVFLKGLVGQIGRIDILIDDGGHRSSDQIVTFNEMFPRLAPDGVYLIEDLHTSYWKVYGGGYTTRNRMVKFLKELVDKVSGNQHPRTFHRLVWCMVQRLDRRKNPHGIAEIRKDLADGLFGYRNLKSFIDFSKSLIDDLNAYHSQSDSLKVSEFTRTSDSLHYYDSVLVIEKRRREKPVSLDSPP